MRKQFAWAVWIWLRQPWAQSSARVTPPPKARPAQPIPFNHKTHAIAGLTCLACHTIAAPGDLAGIPGAAFCMGCHDTVKKDSPAIQTLKAFASGRKPIPWVRIYKVPRFYPQILLSRATINKPTSSAPFAMGRWPSATLVVQEKSTAMADCMKCHDQ